MRSEPIVVTDELTKIYGNKVAVENLSMSISEGEIFGLLGPNGAGKSTAILMLLGLTEPTSGRATVCGFDSTREPLKVKRVTGYFPEKVGFYNDMTASENLRYTARLNNISEDDIPEKIDNVLGIVGLSEVGNQIVKQYSRGMKQRLGIADVLVKDPRMVILDEPTAGLDPEGASQILDTIADMNKKQNMTIIISSHQLNLVQRICHRVAILSDGKKVADGTIEELGRKMLGSGRYRIEIEVANITDELVEKIKNLKGMVSVEVKDNAFHLICEEDSRPQIAKTVVDSNCLLVQMKIQDYALEEIYLNYFHGE
ncbi:MAG: ABC transporter ATP-binding protein [Actinobacteria bacterium]|nr:ABC transporter ATP-binding protein [Actinomycetota bacterium]